MRPEGFSCRKGSRRIILEPTGYPVTPSLSASRKTEPGTVRGTIHKTISDNISFVRGWANHYVSFVGLTGIFLLGLDCLRVWVRMSGCRMFFLSVLTFLLLISFAGLLSISSKHLSRSPLSNAQFCEYSAFVCDLIFPFWLLPMKMTQ